MKLGQFQLDPVSDGFFKLDGGAMFGIIPKPLWEKLSGADRENRILLGLNPLLVRTGKENVLIDTGIGNKYTEKQTELFAIQRPTDLVQSLNALGLSVDEIDLVVCTHLHFDHIGGNTFRGPDRKAVPRFPKARYFMQRGAWEEATRANARTQGSYIEDDFLPIKAAGQLELVEGNVQPVRGLRYEVTGGHTKHHAVVHIESERQHAIFLGDLVPTTAHLGMPYIMGYDLYPLQTLEAKRRLLKEAVDKGWICAFEHDPRIALARLKYDGKKFLAEQLEA